MQDYDNVSITNKEAFTFLQHGAILVDLRREDYKNGRIFEVSEIISLFYRDFEEKYQSLPKDRILILADYVGIQSKKYALFLRAQGWSEVYSLTGGILGWETVKLPLKIDRKLELVGGCACKLRPRNTVKE